MSSPDTTAGIETVAAAPRTTVNAATANAKVFVALPWQKQTNPITSHCVNRLCAQRRVTTGLNFGDAFVAHSRNNCADLFLGTDCEWMLMIDDDMLIPFGNAGWYNAYSGFRLPDQFAGMNAIDRLLSHGKTLVGGLYFGRHVHGAPMYAEGCATVAEGDFARSAPVDLIKPTRWVATGCLMIHRSVFLDIEKRFPRLARGRDGKKGHWFTASEHTVLDRLEKLRTKLADGAMTGEKAFTAYSEIEEILKEARHVSALGMGEDVSFSVRAAQAGHTPYVDFGLVCGHIGHAVYGPGNTSRRRV